MHLHSLSKFIFLDTNKYIVWVVASSGSFGHTHTQKNVVSLRQHVDGLVLLRDPHGRIQLCFLLITMLCKSHWVSKQRLLCTVQLPDLQDYRSARKWQNKFLFSPSLTHSHMCHKSLWTPCLFKEIRRIQLNLLIASDKFTTLVPLGWMFTGLTAPTSDWRPEHVSDCNNQEKLEKNIRESEAKKKEQEQEF